MMSKLKRLALNEEGFLFDPSTGNCYLLNATAIVVLRGLQEDLTESQLLARIVERFDVEPQAATRDIEDFILQLNGKPWL